MGGRERDREGGREIEGWEGRGWGGREGDRGMGGREIEGWGGREGDRGMGREGGR